MAEHPAENPLLSRADPDPSAGARVLWRWPMDPGVQVETLRRVWRLIGEPLPPDSLAVVRFRYGDDQMYRRVLQGFCDSGSEPMHSPTARAGLLQVGARTEFVACGHWPGFDPPAAERLREDFLAACRNATDSIHDDPEPPPTGRRWAPDARVSTVRTRTSGSIHALRVADSPHLHLIHPGGGQSSVYRPLVGALPSSWTVTCSDDIGRGATVETLAAIYLRELLPAAGEPDLLGGWSLGGLIAFQMARLLFAGKRRPPALVLLDTPPPGSSGVMPDLARITLEFAGMLWASLGLAEQYLPEVLDLDDDTIAMRILAVALRTAGEPIEVELLLEQLDAYCRHRSALTTYAPPLGLATPALMVTTATDETAHAWRRLLLDEPTVVAFPGGHYDLLAPDRLSEVARLITELAEP